MSSRQRKQKRPQRVRKSRSNPRSGLMSLSSHPPPYQAQSSRSMTIRCLASGAVTQQSFTYSNLSRILGVVAVSTTAGAYITTVFRISRIRVWGPVAVAGTSVTVAVTYTETSNDFETPPVSRADTSISFDHPAFVTLRPPRGSLLDKWHGSAQTDEAFALTIYHLTTNSLVPSVVNTI